MLVDVTFRFTHASSHNVPGDQHSCICARLLQSLLVKPVVVMTHHHKRFHVPEKHSAPTDKRALAEEHRRNISAAIRMTHAKGQHNMCY